MKKGENLNIILSKRAQVEHVPGTLWDRDDPNIQIKWRQFQDYIKIIQKQLQANEKRYHKVLADFLDNIDNSWSSDEALDETLGVANAELKRIADSMDSLFYDEFHDIIQMSLYAKGKGSNGISF